jgi:hypothetical protein
LDWVEVFAYLFSFIVLGERQCVHNRGLDISIKLDEVTTLRVLVDIGSLL